MSNTWKVGDEFCVDYDNLLLNEPEHFKKSWTKDWFPPEKQPFIIAEIRSREVECTTGYVVGVEYIYNKSMIINQILKEI